MRSNTPRWLYQSLGCETVRLEAEAHDRTMAYTQALTYFITKGMLDIGVGPEIAFAPPSFRAIAQTIAAVQSDAGHLFAAMHRENLFAAEARERLLQALSAVDRALRSADEDLFIPRADSADPADAQPAQRELREIRQAIDSVDHELLTQLERRVQLALRAGMAKASAISLPSLEIAGAERTESFVLVENVSEYEMTLRPQGLEPAPRTEIPFLPDLSSSAGVFRTRPGWSLREQASRGASNLSVLASSPGVHCGLLSPHVDFLRERARPQSRPPSLRTQFGCDWQNTL